jgi:hypothetical protein
MNQNIRIVNGRKVTYKSKPRKRKRPLNKHANAFKDCKQTNPKSEGNIKSYNALGIYKGARIMKAEKKIPVNYYREMEIKGSNRQPTVTENPQIVL